MVGKGLWGTFLVVPRRGRAIPADFPQLAIIEPRRAQGESRDPPRIAPAPTWIFTWEEKTPANFTREPIALRERGWQDTVAVLLLT